MSTERVRQRTVDQSVDVPGVLQRQVPTFQQSQKAVAVPHVQLFDGADDVPVSLQRQNSHDPEGAEDVGISTSRAHRQSRGCSRDGTKTGPLSPESQEDGEDASDPVHRRGG